MDPTNSSPKQTREPTSVDLSSFPFFFVLPIHLSLEELHDVEETLAKSGAAITYDITEAQVLIGKLSQKKRAALELRARGLWTEEASIVDEIPVKRRRLNSPSKITESNRKSQVISLDSASEIDDEHGSGSETGTKPILKSSVEVTSVASQATLQDNEVRVIRLDWLRESLAVGHSLPLDQFTIYNAIKVPRPDVPTLPISVSRLSPESEHQAQNSPRTPPQKQGKDPRAILERAKADAATTPQPRYTPPTGIFRRAKLSKGGSTSPKPRPKLYRQTTEEFEETASLPPAPDWVKNNVVYSCLRSATLHPPNEQFIDQLLKIKRIRELTLDDIGVRAYSTSISAIAAYPYPLQTPEEVRSIPGCENRIANWFAEWKQSQDGTLEAANQLDTDPVFSTLNLFYNIWGVGAKSARDFYYHRQWRSLDDIVEQGWDSLSRVQQIGLKYYQEFLDGIPRKEVEYIANTILEHARRARPNASYDGKGIESVIVGGYRRGKEYCGDVDIILTHRDEVVTQNLIYDTLLSLEQDGWITHTLALHLTNTARDQQPLPYRGETTRGKHHFDTLDKALVVWQKPNTQASFSEYEREKSDAAAKSDPSPAGEVSEHSTKETSHQESQKSTASKPTNTNPHRRVDIIISPWRSIGCAVLGWSGDTTFERDLRRHAKKAHNWKFDSSGIRAREGSGGRVIDLESSGETWQERERLVMEGLGVGWRPPEERCTR